MTLSIYVPTLLSYNGAVVAYGPAEADYTVDSHDTLDLVTLQTLKVKIEDLVDEYIRKAKTTDKRITGEDDFADLIGKPDADEKIEIPLWENHLSR